MEEVAKLFGTHRNTIRGWLKLGLERVDNHRPTLILGRKLSAFLHARRKAPGSAAGPGSSIACVAARPETQQLRRAEYLPITSSFGKPEGDLLGLRHPHVPAGLAAQARRCWPAILRGRAAAGAATYRRYCLPLPKL